MNYCEQCGSELTSLFCESCGTISTNIPTSMSNDDSLAGLLANVIQQGKTLSFTQVLSLTKSLERTYRIFSQLEKTANFLIKKQDNEYVISLMPSAIANQNFLASLAKKDQYHLMKLLLDLFTLSEEEVNTFFQTPVHLREVKKVLGKHYELKLEKGRYILRKTN